MIERLLYKTIESKLFKGKIIITPENIADFLMSD